MIRLFVYLLVGPYQMSVIKPDYQFKKRYFLRNVGLFIPLAICFLLLWCARGQFNLYFWSVAGLFITGITLWALWDRLLLRSYHCPSCGQKIPSPTIQHRKADDPIRYYCQKCDIEWDTGLKEAGD